MTANLSWQEGYVQSADREKILGHKSLTIWFTGLSGAGKSTLAFLLERRFVSAGYMSYVLDGDNVRHGLNKDLGFSPESRSENIRRVAEVAKLFNEAGAIVLCAFISPTTQDRELAKSIVGADNFFEVHVSTPLSECERRDPKGLYQRARIGNLKNFTGIDAPYEIPLHPDIAVDTFAQDFDSCLQLLFDAIQSRTRLHGDGNA